VRVIRVRNGLRLAAGGLCAVAFLGGSAASADGLGFADGAVPGGSVGACTAYAYRAIERHVLVTRPPPACGGLTSGQVSLAVGTAIREAAGGVDKAESRRRTAGDARWVSALITQPSPAGQRPSVAAAPGSGSAGTGGGRLGGISDLAVRIAALLAWLVTAGSGAYLLLRWLLAGGRLRVRGGRAASATAVPPAVAAGHAGFALTGLLGWTLFTITGWAWLAWACLAVLLPVAGLGMGILLLGLPAPAEGRTAVRRSRGTAWPVIAGHGIAAVTLLLLVITAAVAT
jgi:hypothetical protein